jgi:hypothetical protein
VEEGESFPASFVGPTFVWGWELATPLGDLDGIGGPRAFSIGEAEFVIRNPGTVTVSYYTQEPWETLVAGQGFEFNDLVIYEDLEVGTVVQVESLAILALPEPTGWLAQSAGLVLLCALRRLRTRKRGG